MESGYHQSVEILLTGTSKIYRFKSIKELLPFSFVDEDMKPEDDGR